MGCDSEQWYSSYVTFSYCYESLMTDSNIVNHCITVDVNKAWLWGLPFASYISIMTCVLFGHNVCKWVTDTCLKWINWFDFHT